jgi:hypothetical protein
MMATTTRLLYSSTPLWTIDLAGRGTPVINENKAYVLGYEGAGPDLQQVFRCVNGQRPKRSAICRKGFAPKVHQIEELEKHRSSMGRRRFLAPGIAVGFWADAGSLMAIATSIARSR